MSEPFTLQSLYPRPERLRFGSHLHLLITDDSWPMRQQRAYVNAVLAFAHAHHWLDDEMMGRLRASDDAVVLSILDELAIAGWLFRSGYSLQFNPPGASGRVGELLLRHADIAIFVEVKSLLQAEMSLMHQIVLAHLHEACATIPLAATLLLEINSSPHSGVSIRELRRYLAMGASQLLAGGPVPPAYVHNSGIHLRAIACTPTETTSHLLVQVVGEEWPGLHARDQRIWRERLWRALRGGYSQLPHGGPPTLIIVVDHTDTSDISHWLEPFQEMLRMGLHRHLSAVMRLALENLRAGTLDPVLLLNPNAAIPFPALPFTAAGERRVCVLPPRELTLP